MARRTPTAPDLAKSVIAGTFTTTGVSASSAFFPGGINFWVWGSFVAIVEVERSFDGGQTWHALEQDISGTNYPVDGPRSVVFEEVESGVLYRMNCTSISSGTVNFRMSQG